MKKAPKTPKTPKRTVRGYTKGRNKPREYPKGKMKRTIVGATGSPMARIAKPLAEKDLKFSVDQPRKKRLAEEYLATYDRPSKGRNKPRKGR